MELLRSRMAESSIMASLLPLEGAVDPDEYLVGPGDFFTVVVGSVQGSAAPIPISADGRLPLPEAGSVDVAGMTLAQARATAIDALRGAFGSVPVDVTLAQPRQFYVHVSGAVPVPGRHISLPVGRVSSALEVAFADTSRAALSNPKYRPSLRNVILIHRDGTEKRLDLMQYFSAGQTVHNPYLRDGDVIMVPGYDPAYQSVHVDGAVPFPGGYDVRPGDNLQAVLRAAGMTERVDHVGIVRVTRGDGGETELIPMDDALGERGFQTRIFARDHVAVTPEELPGGTATVDGWVRYPGTYSIRQGKTTIRELLDLAGGVREEGDVGAAILERRALPVPQLPTSPEGRSQEVPGLDKLLRADTLAIMQRLRLTDLDFLSRVYFAQELRTQNRVSVDLEAVLSGETEPVILRDGDRLVVPRDDNTVYVAGQVIRPGYVLHVPDKTLEYYIANAGGRGTYASETYMVRGTTGEVVRDRNAVVRSGDVIFVDRAEDLAEDADMQRLVLQLQTARADAKIRVAQTVAQVIGSLATVLALIVTLTR